MGFFAAVTALGASGPLASRAFLPLLLVLLLVRYPWLLPEFLGARPIQLPAGMEWIGSDWTLAAVAVLAVVEVLADKSPEIKELNEQVMLWVRSVVAVLVALTVLPGDTARLIPAVQQAGLGGPLVLALAAGALTWYLCRVRARLLALVRELDDDGSLGLHRLISWLEDLWSGLGLLLVIVFPLAALLLTAALFLAVWLVQRALQGRQDARRAPCPGCGEAALPEASRCKGCHAELEPREVLGWGLTSASAGGALDAAARQAHTQRQVARRRCPLCGERAPLQQLIGDGCAQCGGTLSADQHPGWYQAYLDAATRRGWALLAPLALASLLPVVGFAVTVVATKLVVVQPLRVALSRPQLLALRWGLRLLTLLLLIPANLPLVSLLAAPAVALANLLAYRAAALSAGRRLGLSG